MTIFLIGFMGSGKSYVGRRLAAQLEYEFIDLDDMLEAGEGRSIPTIFSEEGEVAFRQKESFYLQKIDNQANTIVSTGGGTPCFLNNMDWMNEQGVTIYLHVSPLLLFKRLKNKRAHRPILQGKTEAELLDFITQKLNERAAFYDQAQVIFTVENNGDEIIDDIYAYLTF